jgi:hypothetical protein
MARLGSVLLGAASAAVLVLPAAATELVSHRAVYDLTLGSTEASASIVTASGRLVFEIAGSSCEGYTVNSRFVTRVTDREGLTRTSDMRSATYETLEPATFSFRNETFVDGEADSEVNGEARLEANGLVVTLTAPKESSVELPRAIFPTAHTRLILDSVAAGDRVVEAPVFDSGDTADTIYDTTTVIGPATEGLPGASESERRAFVGLPDAATIPTHRLVISYFAANQPRGEPTPDHELAFTLLQNGISYDVTFDYGTFSLIGRLAELSLLPTTPCEE